MEEGRPVDQLFPLKEIDALDENAPQPTRLPTQPDEIWFEPTTTNLRPEEAPLSPVDEEESRANSPIEIRVVPSSPTTERSPRRRSAMDEAAHEREQVQKALESCLEDFRAGKMRACKEITRLMILGVSVTDTQVKKLRAMHENQLRLTAMHQEIMKMDDPLK
jgi:hypothetical protein